MSSPAPDLSRRQWLGLVAAPALAASLVPAARAATATPSNDLGARIYNIRDFGAIGDGRTLDTAALQSAVDACAHDGGGTVLVPAGKFLIGTVELRSNLTLHLAASATLLGSADGKNYHAVDAIPLHGDATLEDGNYALLFAVDGKNLTIEGAGTIDGQGIQFHPAVRGTPPPSGLGGNNRPYHILCHRCEDLVIRDLKLLACAYHSIRVIQSKRITIDGLYLHNRVNGNNDGFHFISAEHVTISNCTVFCQDDACALFGSCRFVTVTNCTFSTRWSVFRFGGGVAEHIAVSNCIFYQVFGCPIKFHGRPGDRFENMSFSNLVLHEVTGPIHLSLGDGSRRDSADGAILPPRPGPARPPAIARNISFTNVRGTVTTNPPPLPDYPFPGAYNPGELRSCIALNSIGDTVLENISFSDIHLTFGGGGTAEDGARRDLPRVAGEYFHLGPMPAYGFYARHCRGLTLHNIRFQLAARELRPAVILDHVEDVAINGLTVQGDPDAESALRFIDTKHVLLTAPRLLGSAAAFLQLEGAANSSLTLDGGDISSATTPLALKSGATEKAIRLRT